MQSTTWIRVEDDFAQFDHPKGTKLPAGVTAVADYPEHVGPWARDPKRRVPKGGKKADGYDAQLKADLEAEVARRNEGRPDEDLIVVDEPGNKPDLVTALVADDLRDA